MRGTAPSWGTGAKEEAAITDLNYLFYRFHFPRSALISPKCLYNSLKDPVAFLRFTLGWSNGSVIKSSASQLKDTFTKTGETCVLRGSSAESLVPCWMDGCDD